MTTVDAGEMDDALMRYFVERHNDRHREVEAILAAMTKRERALVREVAVMANVAALPHGERPAKDSEVVVDVISRCLTMPDLYPTLARLARIAQRRSAILRPDQHDGRNETP